MQFVHTGGGQPPEWYHNLVLAEIWHCFPWELEHAPVKWILRQSALTNARAESERVKREGGYGW